jgi:hypothetical protein
MGRDEKSSWALRENRIWHWDIKPSKYTSLGGLRLYDGLVKIGQVFMILGHVFFGGWIVGRIETQRRKGSQRDLEVGVKLNRPASGTGVGAKAQRNL